MRPNQRKNWLVERKDEWDKSHYDPLWTIVPRMIEASIGKPWNETFSKICERWPKNSKEGYRVRYIVKCTVETNPRRWWYANVIMVDENGILTRVEDNYVRQWREPEKTKIPVSDTHHYQKIDGFWYELRYVKEMARMRDPIPSWVSDPWYAVYRQISKRRMSNDEVLELVLNQKPVNKARSEGSSRAQHVHNGKTHPKVGNKTDKPKHVRTAPPPTPGWIQPTVWGTPR